MTDYNVLTSTPAVCVGADEKHNTRMFALQNPPAWLEGQPMVLGVVNGITLHDNAEQGDSGIAEFRSGEGYGLWFFVKNSSS